MQDQLKEANLETFEQQLDSIWLEYPDPPALRPRKRFTKRDRVIRQRLLKGTMCGGKPMALIMALNDKKLKSQFPRKVSMQRDMLSTYLRAKYAADPDSLNLREAKEWLKFKLNDALGSVRRKKRLRDLKKYSQKLEVKIEDCEQTIREQDHEAHLVSVI